MLLPQPERRILDIDLEYGAAAASAALPAAAGRRAGKKGGGRETHRPIRQRRAGARFVCDPVPPLEHQAEQPELRGLSGLEKQLTVSDCPGLSCGPWRRREKEQLFPSV